VPYLGLRLHAAAVVAEQLHLALGDSAGGGGFGRHGGRGVLERSVVVYMREGMEVGWRESAVEECNIEAE
jgi:hypothetical protein